MSDESTPQEVIPEEPAPPAFVLVVVLRPLCEVRRTYPKGSILETTQARGEQLMNLGLVETPPPVSWPWWAFWRSRTPGNGRR